MSKRKQPEADEAPATPSKRQRRASAKVREASAVEPTPGRLSRLTPKRIDEKPLSTAESHDRSRSGSPTPKPNSTILSTPTKRSIAAARGSARKQLDQSAKRKGVRKLVEHQQEDDWDGEIALARRIVEDEGAEPIQELVEDATSEIATPKRGRGRPKGARNRRSPTPEGDLAPEERYFFQNRSGPAHISENQFTSVKLLTHDEYLAETKTIQTQHLQEKAFLKRLHRRAFPQWKFELEEGFAVCLYGYGSKRALTKDFAEWISAKSHRPAKIVIVNGYVPKLNVKAILNTIATAVGHDDEAPRLIGPPQDMVDTLLQHLSRPTYSSSLMIMVNSIDSNSLRKPGVQDVFARLASHPQIRFLATADMPTFPLLWHSAILDQFQFAYHDCTTFDSQDTEIPVVDEIYGLLGRKRRRIGGREGIKYVLKSLPPNAQNLYRILLGELLSVLGAEDDEEADVEDEERVAARKRQGHEAAEDVGVEYRLLYQKASEEFVASSDMNFRFLLKEFHDHQMITSRQDASGTELLCVPLGKEDMQAVLKDLVIS